MQDLGNSCRSRIIITSTLAGNWRLILPLIQFTPLASLTWNEEPLSTLIGIAFIPHAAINISSHTGVKERGKMWRMDVLITPGFPTHLLVATPRSYTPWFGSLFLEISNYTPWFGSLFLEISNHILSQLQFSDLSLLDLCNGCYRYSPRGVGAWTWWQGHGRARHVLSFHSLLEYLDYLSPRRERQLVCCCMG